MYKRFLIALLVTLNSMHCRCENHPDTIVNSRGIRRIMHIGWENGHLGEFSGAYIIHRNEIKINLIGPSSFSMSDKLQISTYIPLLLFPNIAIKYKWTDSPRMASSLEMGSGFGIVPFYYATGFVFPGAAVGIATAGLLHGSIHHLKGYFSFPLSERWVLSVRANTSMMRFGDWGVAALGGIGKGGAVAGIIPIVISRRFFWNSAGIESSFLLDHRNAIVFNTATGYFSGSKNGIGMATLSWTHAQKHFHITTGFYTFFDTPRFEILKNSKLPVSVYANIYWIFNNGRRIKTN